MARNVSEAEFGDVVLKATQPVLVDFWADWCGPCHAMAPIIEALAKEMDGKALVVKVDVDANQALANQYNVMSIPTFMFFKNGEKKDQLIGGQAKETLAAKLNALV